MFATYESIANDMFYDSKDRRLVAIEKLVAIKGARNILGYIGYVYGELTNMCNEGLDSSDIYLFSHRLNTYFDYVKMVDYLRDTENRIHRPEWKFKSLDEIEQAHNSVLTVYNLTHNVRDYQEKQEKFEKLWTKERYDKFQYFGKEFSVIAPKDVLEIANEGSLLHHCAKSYIDDVINDVTNILFVRRNENLARAFYTLEIQENAVRQCHGFGNCNIDREKGLEAFLMEYCEKKGFEYKNPDLVLAAV
jgi:hypothetical protein